MVDGFFFKSQFQFDNTDGITWLAVFDGTVTNHNAFDQRDSNSVPKFERVMDRCCRALVSRFL